METFFKQLHLHWAKKSLPFHLIWLLFNLDFYEDTNDPPRLLPSSEITEHSQWQDSSWKSIELIVNLPVLLFFKQQALPSALWIQFFLQYFTWPKIRLLPCIYWDSWRVLIKSKILHQCAQWNITQRPWCDHHYPPLCIPWWLFSPNWRQLDCSC